jgi:arylformamidase
VSDWIDVSVPVRNGMVHWPNDPPFELRRVMRQEKGDVCTLSHISLSVHTGTHMDAPLHFIVNGPTIDQMPVDATVGRARVIEIRDRHSIRREELLEHEISDTDRILFKTANSDHSWNGAEFDEDFIFIARDAAEHLAESGVRCVGIDYLSVGGYKQDAVETHQALLSAGIWVIEGLNLSGGEPGEYDLVCLPLKLVGAEGAPARAILRSVE